MNKSLNERETIAYTCCDKKEKAVHSIAAFQRKTTANSTKFQNHAECLENFFLFRPRKLISTDASESDLIEVKKQLAMYCPIAKVIRNSGTTINENWTKIN